MRVPIGDALRHIARTLPGTVQWHARRRIIEDTAVAVDGMAFPLDNDVRAFHRKFGHPSPERPTLLGKRAMDFRIRLIREECEELVRAIEERDLPRIAGEAVDLLYVVVGTLVACGVRLMPVWRAVHAANMAKAPNPGGKPRKPEGWRPPDLRAAVGEWKDTMSGR